jgi:hypothetical protein
MTEEVKKQADTRTATQRLTDAENNVAQAFLTLDIVTNDIKLIKSALKLLDNKLNALIKANVDGKTVTDDLIDELMLQNNIADLASKVESLVKAGAFTAEEAISENSFVVGQDIGEDGTIFNPRVQFAIRTLAKEKQEKLIGTKVGDSVIFTEEKFSFKVLESYTINRAPAPQQPTAPSTPPSEPVAPPAQEPTPTDGSTAQA